MKTRSAAPVLLSKLALSAGLLASTNAMAGPADTVYRPVVEKGETEVEFRNGYRDYSGGANEYATVMDLGYGVTNRWQTELVLEYSGITGFGGSFEALEWENIFVITEQGQHWADLGLIAEYEHSYAAGPDVFKIGPLIEKEVGPTIVDLNLIFEHEVGSGASSDTELNYAWQVKWRGREALEWGVQGFGSMGVLSRFGEEDVHSVGPALFGLHRLGSGNKISYNAAALVGLNRDAPDLTARFSVEYEIY